MKTLLVAIGLFSGTELVFAAEQSPFQIRAIADVATATTTDYPTPKGEVTSKTVFVESAVLLDHTAIESISLEGGPAGSVHFYFTFTDAGNKRLSEITSQYLRKRVGFVIDGQLVAAPIVGEVIPAGKLAITARLTMQEAEVILKKLQESLAR